MPCLSRRQEAGHCSRRSLCTEVQLSITKGTDDRIADSHVRVWSTEAILSANNPDYTGPKQLAAMNYHSGTIHSVRFSPNGKYLASGADDKFVCIYTLDPNPPSHTVFGMKEANVRRRTQANTGCRIE